MPPPSTPFGKELSRAFRSAVADYERTLGRPLKQFELGQMIGCSQSQAGKILRGEARPSWGIVEKIAEHFPVKSRDEWLTLAGYGRVEGIGEEPDERADIARRAADEAVTQVLQRLGLTADSGIRKAPDLSKLKFGQNESPKERLERRRNHAAAVLLDAGFTVPPMAQGSHGGVFKTDSAADNAYLLWLETVERRNEGRKVPDELREE